MTISIIYMVLLTVIYAVEKWASSKKSALVQAYKETLEATEKRNDEALKYVLTDIMRRCVEREEYDTAVRCREIIKQIENKKPLPSI